MMAGQQHMVASNASVMSPSTAQLMKCMSEQQLTQMALKK